MFGLLAGRIVVLVWKGVGRLLGPGLGCGIGMYSSTQVLVLC